MREMIGHYAVHGSRKGAQGSVPVPDGAHRDRIASRFEVVKLRWAAMRDGIPRLVETLEVGLP